MAGLDAYSALQVIRTLKSLSQKGRTVIVSVHSPRSEIWALFDRVVLLSGGSVLYSGIADGAVPYFRKSGYDIGAFVNPAEFLVDLAAVDSRCERAQQICHLRVQRLKEAWNRASSEHEAIATTQTRTGTFKFHQSGVGFYRQIFVLTKRDVNTTLREPGGALGSIAQAIIMAVSFGMVFFSESGQKYLSLFHSTFGGRGI
jgi:ABC-type multidrug transport system ATPase subunit